MPLASRRRSEAQSQSRHFRDPTTGRTTKYHELLHLSLSSSCSRVLTPSHLKIQQSKNSSPMKPSTSLSLVSTTPFPDAFRSLLHMHHSEKRKKRKTPWRMLPMIVMPSCILAMHVANSSSSPSHESEVPSTLFSLRFCCSVWPLPVEFGFRVRSVTVACSRFP